jgi:hypothetical protein
MGNVSLTPQFLFTLENSSPCPLNRRWGGIYRRCADCCLHLESNHDCLARSYVYHHFRGETGIRWLYRNESNTMEFCEGDARRLRRGCYSWKHDGTFDWCDNIWEPAVLTLSSSQQLMTDMCDGCDECPRLREQRIASISAQCRQEYCTKWWMLLRHHIHSVIKDNTHFTERPCLCVCERIVLSHSHLSHLKWSCNMDFYLPQGHVIIIDCIQNSSAYWLRIP